MRKLWRRSVKLRLTLWYGLAMCVVLSGFAYAVYEVVEHRLAAEIDRQLRIDFDVVEGQLEKDGAGRVLWSVHGAHGDEGFARLYAWFEVWSEDGALLLRRWPVREAEIRRPLPAPRGAELSFYRHEIEPGLRVRVMERPARLAGDGIVLRVFRDETSMRQTLQQIIDVFLFALPFVVLAASIGGYVLAGRALAPVTAMTEQARKITSESLQARLPNPNPADEFGQLATVINETLSRLQCSFDELKRFTADASHELRTPLTALRTVGEVALRSPDESAAVLDALKSMLEEAQRLSELTEALLTLARTEGPRLKLQPEPLQILDVAYEIADGLSLLAQEKEQNLQIAGEADVRARADRVLLYQALLNIMHNAIRYSPSKSQISVHTRRSGDDAIIEVMDQGPGIRPEHKTKVFDRFFRVDAGRSRADGGFGLGLAIAKAAIERQGGRIEVDSESGRGSTFRIRLPAVA
jgi:heavy metal sensor kinase